MKPKIIVVEDNKDIQNYLKQLLEYENYEIISSSDGKEALDILSKRIFLPDLIISDIMMPIMDGYEFFEAISKIDYLNQIPFIFLTAKNTNDDIRFGKMLGADDYITKPFNKEDLLAIIEGKLLKYNKIKNYNKKLLNIIDKEDNTKHKLSHKNDIMILIVFWDNEFGPKLEKYYPKKINDEFSIHQIAIQLFMAATSIYGQNDFLNAEGILLDIKNINKKGYIFFDCIQKDSNKSMCKNFMLGVLATNINYFKSLKIKEIFIKLSKKIKQNIDYDIENYWYEVSNIIE